MADAAYFVDGDGTLDGFANTGIDTDKGFGVVHVAAVDGTQIDGSQHSHIERTAVAAQAASFQKLLVVADEWCVELAEPEVVAIDKAQETVFGTSVGLGSSASPIFLQVSHQLVDKLNEGGNFRCFSAVFRIAGGDELILFTVYDDADDVDVGGGGVDADSHRGGRVVRGVRWGR